MTDPARQRLDKWLWFARVTKSRTLAAKLAAEGHVRINGVRHDSPSKSVTPGDVLTISLDRQVRVLKVLAPGERRGPFTEARLLYEDLLDQDSRYRDLAPPANTLKLPGSDADP